MYAASLPANGCLQEVTPFAGSHLRSGPSPVAAWSVVICEMGNEFQVAPALEAGISFRLPAAKSIR
jgi:hypothetical protein